MAEGVKSHWLANMPEACHHSGIGFCQNMAAAPFRPKMWQLVRGAWVKAPRR